MTPNPEPVQPMAPGQVLHWSSPWKEAHLPCFLLTPLMDLPSWTWSHRRGLRPLQSWPMESLRGTVTTTAKDSALAKRTPWCRRSIGDTTAAIIIVKNGAVSGTPGRDLRANSPRPEAQGLCGDGESHGRAAPHLQPVLLGPDQRLRTRHDPAEEKGCREGAVAMEKEASMFSPPHPERWPSAAAKGDRATVKTGRPWLRCWQLHPAPTTATSGDQDSKKAWMGRLGEDRDGEEKEGKEKESRATEEKGGGQEPFSIPPTPFLRPWVSRPEASTERVGDKGAVKEDKAEDPFSIPPTPFLRPWVFWPGEEKEMEESGDLGAAEGAALVPATHPGASRNICTFFRGEDTDSEEEEDWEEEEEEEDSDAGDSEGPSPSVPLNTHMACLRKDWGEEDDEEVKFEKDNSDLAVAEGHASLPSGFLRNWMYQPGEEEEEEEEFLEAADSSLDAPPRVWSPAMGLPKEPCNFQVAFYLPGETPPPPWAPPQPPLRLWLRLQYKPPAPPPPEPAMPQKGRKVRFSEKVTVHLLAVWAGPARAARRGPWEQMARDRSRFARRIAQAQKDLGPYLTAVARARARARLRKLAAAAAVAQPSPLGTPTSCSFQAMPLSPASASPCPLSAGPPSLLVTGRRG